MLKAPWSVVRTAGPALGLLLYRLLLLAVLPYEAVTTYGDLRHFHQLAQLATNGGGLPFIGHWIEFPPLFPFLSLGLNTLVGGMEHVYVYTLAALMACFDTANLYLLGRILTHLQVGEEAQARVWCYFAFLALPAIGWWTFEPLGVFWLLLAVVLVFESGPTSAGIAAGLGLLTKWLPGLGLIVAWTQSATAPDSARSVDRRGSRASGVDPTPRVWRERDLGLAVDPNRPSRRGRPPGH